MPSSFCWDLSIWEDSHLTSLSRPHEGNTPPIAGLETAVSRPLSATSVLSRSVPFPVRVLLGTVLLLGPVHGTAVPRHQHERPSSASSVAPGTQALSAPPPGAPGAMGPSPGQVPRKLEWRTASLFCSPPDGEATCLGSDTLRLAGGAAAAEGRRQCPSATCPRPSSAPWWPERGAFPPGFRTRPRGW